MGKGVSKLIGRRPLATVRGRRPASNALHGKFNEKPIKDQWTADYPETYWEPGGEPERFGDWWHSYSLALDKGDLGPAHAQPLAAGVILGRARSALWRVQHAIQRAGGEVYYCDTDSVHTNLPREEMRAALEGSGISLGLDVGQLELEAGPCVGYYLGPKAYCLCDASGEPVKHALKGVPLKWYEHGVLDVDEGGPFFRQAEPAELPKALKLRAEQRATPPGPEGLRWRLVGDLRRQVFERAIAHPDKGARCAKAGLSSFVSGLKLPDGSEWKKKAVTRTIRPTGRGKRWGDSPTAWAYLTPAECQPKENKQ